MRTKLTIHYRSFNKHKERQDAGYYSDLKINKTAKIEIAIGEPAVEQVLTMYHEFTHHVFDLLTQYEFQPQNNKVVKRADGDELREKWKSTEGTWRKKGKIKKDPVEEIICTKIEKAVKRIFKKELPLEFKKKFFPDMRKL